MHKKCQRLFFTIILTFLSVGCQTKKNNIDYHLSKGITFGTTFHIKYKDTLDRDFSKDFQNIFEKVNRSVSTYHQESIIAKINRGEAVEIDTIFKVVFQKSKKIHRLTRGMFDPTIGLLVNAWGFGAEKQEIQKTPDSTDIAKMMPLVGLDKIKIVGNKLIKPKGMFLDFNAIAKGYGVDLIGLFLEAKGIENYMVEIGGEVRTRGKNPKNSPWNIAIEKPHFDGKRSVQKVVMLNDEAVATSGNYRKYHIDEQGNRYVHTINPKTGWTAKNDLLSASVIGSWDCADLDGIATAMMAMGFQKSKAFAEANSHLKFFFIYLDEEGKTQTYSKF